VSLLDEPSFEGGCECREVVQLPELLVYQGEVDGGLLVHQNVAEAEGVCETAGEGRRVRSHPRRAAKSESPLTVSRQQR
jgi:hypothetical protein